MEYFEKEKELKEKFPASEYVDNKEYTEKIKEFLMKRYDADSVDFLVQDRDFFYHVYSELEQVSYSCKFNAYVRITRDYGHIKMEDCIRVIIEYSYTYDFIRQQTYEHFDTYQKNDSVYIQSPNEGYVEYLGLKKVREY
ncbi:MAG: hypothetical protein AB2421_17790 [Thermotaleaceae bacterium]